VAAAAAVERLTAVRGPSRSAGFAPLVSVAVGAVLFAAFAIGGDAGDGVRALGFMLVVGVVFALGGRSDTLRAVGGSARDERWSSIELRATAFAGVVVLLALVVAWLLELAEGEDGAPYIQLLAVGGVAYVAALAWGRWRG
jgi:hypothetical protein